MVPGYVPNQCLYFTILHQPHKLQGNLDSCPVTMHQPRLPSFRGNLLLFTQHLRHIHCGILGGAFWRWCLCVSHFASILRPLMTPNFSSSKTFYRVSEEIPERQRQFSMAIITVSDTPGIALSGIIAMPVHNAICNLPIPSRLL